MTWTIVARVADASWGIGLGGHLYLEFWDGDQLVVQINGMARNPSTGELSFAGQDDWPLEAVVTTTPIIGNTVGDPITLFSTESQDEFERALSYATNISNYITSQQLPYEAIPDDNHYNSNSVFNSITEALVRAGFTTQTAVDDAKETFDNLFTFGTPGDDKDITLTLWEDSGSTASSTGTGDVIHGDAPDTPGGAAVERDDYLTGTGGDDSIYGHDGDDLLVGGAGNDYLDGGSGSNAAFGGDGADVIGNVDYGYGSAGADNVSAVYIAAGGSGNDTIQASGDNALADGGEGNDTITLGITDGTTSGGSANGGSGDDTIAIFAQSANVNAESGDNNISFGTTSTKLFSYGNTSVNAGSGGDVVIYRYNDSTTSSSDNHSINLGDGNNTVIGGWGDFSIIAGSGNDSITTGVGSDDISTDGGSDIIDGGGGGDVINAGSGSDTIAGHSGDNISAGDGNDQINIAYASNVFVSGGAGVDTYNLSGDYSNITISDSDGLGTVNFSGGAVQGNGTTSNGTQWSLSGKQLTLNGASLSIDDGSGHTASISGFFNGDFDITLQDGYGNAVLIGGDGRALSGGTGAQTYIFNGAYGENTINDSDGQGYISIDGTVLGSAQATLVGANHWQLDGHDLYLNGTTLSIHSEGPITVEDFSNGDFGITLENQPAVLTSGGTGTQAENASTVAYDANATDADNNTIIYSITGIDAALFSIDSDDGEVRFLSSPDYESPSDTGGDNTYNITVHAYDGIADTTLAVAITVTNINDNSSVFTSGGTGTQAENAVTSTVVYDADATDADGGAITYSLTGTDASLFSIDSDDGEVRFLASPDYENPGDSGGNNVYDIIVHANDGTFDTTKNVTISVTDVLDTDPDDNDNDTVGPAPASSSPNGTSGADLLNGTDNNDTINGSSGNDTIYGHNGNDSLGGNNNDDLIYGQTGNDTINAGNQADTVYGGSGDDIITNDASSSTGNGDLFYGGSGNDSITGGNYYDTLYGGSGDDTISGNSGKDLIYGGIGTDSIDAGSDNDTITGGRGADTITGGSGGDDFIYLSIDDGGDIITDFGGADVIDVSAIDSNTNTNGNNAFIFNSTQTSNIQSYKITWHQADGYTYIHADVNGDIIADFSITLVGTISLNSNDFVL